MSYRIHMLTWLGGFFLLLSTTLRSQTNTAGSAATFHLYQQADADADYALADSLYPALLEEYIALEGDAGPTVLAVQRNRVEGYVFNGANAKALDLTVRLRDLVTDRYGYRQAIHSGSLSSYAGDSAEDV